MVLAQGLRGSLFHEKSHNIIIIIIIMPVPVAAFLCVRFFLCCGFLCG
jgi:hypothetical protein